MDDVIDIFKEKVTMQGTEFNSEVRLPEEYVGHDCIIAEIDNVEIEDDKVTILNPDLCIERRLRPFRKGESRLRLPLDYLDKEIIIFIKDL